VPARRLITATALVLAAALASPAAAAGQAGSGPDELWRAYPLDPVTTAPGGAAESSPPAATPEDASVAAPASSGDEDRVWVLAIVVAVVGVVALVALTAVHRARGARRARTPVPAAAAPPEPAPPPEPLPEPAPAPPRRLPGPDQGVLDLARLSAEYLDAVASGSRRPVMDVAGRHGWDVERTRRALGRARAQGLLVGAGRGRAGGALSAEAERLLALSAVAAADHPPRAGPHAVGANGRVGARSP
jgi:hypothetical protein